MSKFGTRAETPATQHLHAATPALHTPHTLTQPTAAQIAQFETDHTPIDVVGTHPHHNVGLVAG